MSYGSDILRGHEQVTGLYILEANGTRYKTTKEVIEKALVNRFVSRTMAGILVGREQLLFRFLNDGIKKDFFGIVLVHNSNDEIVRFTITQRAHGGGSLRSFHESNPAKKLYLLPRK